MHRLTLSLAVVGASIATIFLVYVTFVVLDAGSPGVYRNVTGAMEPTLLIGERFTTRSLNTAEGLTPTLQHGDLVIHQWPPDPTKLFVKRVVGVAGDTLEMRNGELTRNGQRVAEPYAWHAEPEVDPVAEEFRWQEAFGVSRTDSAPSRPLSRNNWGPIAIPPGMYFVLGDNRDNSLDSRYWGFLPAANVVGIPRRVYFSQDPTTRTIRWTRFGHLLK